MTDTIYLDKTDPTVKLDIRVNDRPSSPRPAMLVIPGGAYAFVCNDREGEPIARRYFSAGFNTFTLTYSINELSLFPRPLVQASLAMKYIRENAGKLNVDPTRVYVVGFSAGGHLAAALSSMWKDESIREAVDMPYGINRPDGCVLSYAVVSPDASYDYEDIFDNITEGWGKKCATDEKRRRWDAAAHIDADTPPAFIWHTSDDGRVKVDNALVYGLGLKKYDIPFEMHIYPRGDHGLSLADHEVCDTVTYEMGRIGKWIDLSIEWIRTLRS